MKHVMQLGVLDSHLARLEIFENLLMGHMALLDVLDNRVTRLARELGTSGAHYDAGTKVEDHLLGTSVEEHTEELQTGTNPATHPTGEAENN